MPVERDIDLNKPLSSEDIDYLEEEANRLEELAKEAQEDAKKTKEFQKEEEKVLNDAVKKVEKIEKEADKAEKAKNKIGKSIKEVNELAEHQAPLGGMEGGEKPSFGLGGMDPSAGQMKARRMGFGTGQERSPLGLIPGEIRQAEMRRLADEKLAKEEREKLKDEDKKAEEHRRDLEKKLREQKQMIGKIGKGGGDAMNFMQNPAGMAMGKLKGLIGRAGIYGLIALMVWQMAEQVFKEIKRLYAPGGPYDERKQMQDRDQEIIEIAHILDRRSGRVFFTADTEVTQGSPEFSNTSRLGHRTVRFQAMHLGE